MIEVRKTTDKEKAKHSNMPYLIDLGHSKQWFTEKALIELLDKTQTVVNENGLLPFVSVSFFCYINKSCLTPNKFPKCDGCLYLIKNTQ